ncbi:IS4 family transposase [Pedobacter sp. SL55]|uniref:IS4 family transposase n=1 Tax=Pedobacter sp. SL55 TaxID=2995161 RepID=UPI002270BE2C|nr:IS4 family transposase [Pedobacter sp. SL55]WAC42142.1 IS4 family transposase [Pedobacter sp. SL55]
MARKPPFHFVELSHQFISSQINIEKYRTCRKDFTRNRKFGFRELSLSMLRTLKQNIQVELQKFLDDIKSCVYSFTTSAFVQGRKKIKPDMFLDLNAAIASDFYRDNDDSVQLYKGHRLLAIDGSTINLPISPSTIAEYGFCNNQKKTDDVVMARVSILYDVLNEIAIDGRLSRFSVGEVALARQQLQLAQCGDIVIMDRAYTSFGAMRQMGGDGIHFICRCKIAYSNATRDFALSGKDDDILVLSPKQNRSFNGLPYDKNTSITVRMLRIPLSTGEDEILITSLLDARAYPYADFKELYFKRWAIETYYNRFKNIIGVEHFSGTSCQFILQEFYCALYMSNMQAILTMDAQQQARKKYEHRTYEYRINASLSLCFIRNRLIELFSSKTGKEAMDELEQLFVKNVVPLRPNRNFDRKTDKYRQRTKPKQFKNRRINL